jgi:glucose/arabinose dehydrogenase
MQRALWAGLLLITLPMAAAAADKPKPWVEGLTNPESVAVGPDGRVYVSVIGDFDKDGDGAVLVIDKERAVPLARGLDDPKGLAVWQQWLFVADKTRVWRIDTKDPRGKAQVFAAADAFPSPPRFLNDLAVDEEGNLYASDSGDLQGKGGAVYRINPRGKVSLVTDATRVAGLHTPNGLVMDGKSFLLLLDFGTGTLYRVKVADGSAAKVADGFGGGDGLAWDNHGRLYVTDWKGGRVFVIPRPGEKPVLVSEGFQSAADLCLDPTRRFLLVPDMKAGTLTKLPAQVPGREVDDSPLPLETAVAFPKLRWTGWKPENDRGQPTPLRPLVLTHAGDGSGRVFVATQHGVIHVFPNDQQVEKTRVFLDLQDRVRYDDNTNEEGFLGLAFHPDYKTNGEFFVFYTLKKPRLTNVLSRFRVRKDDPDRADPDSEEVLLRVQRPFWNHDGGTLCFGPDGFLYFTLGDGGDANDPFKNGQNLKTLLGKVLRIDVDHKDPGKGYAVPRDNPFVGRPDILPEIYAYGLRNVWRMAFDRPTKVLWAADVGQNLYEEIDHITPGGNYGWNLREGLHPFGADGVGPRKDLIDPIWEYPHDVGKSITGGCVYRGERLPELQGLYLYADYVSNRLWALGYDADKKRVVRNHPIPDKGVPILSFGEDEKGEVYLMTFSGSGRGVYHFVRPAGGKR